MKQLINFIYRLHHIWMSAFFKDFTWRFSFILLFYFILLSGVIGSVVILENIVGNLGYADYLLSFVFDYNANSNIEITMLVFIAIASFPGIYLILLFPAAVYDSLFKSSTQEIKSNVLSKRKLYYEDSLEDLKNK